LAKFNTIATVNLLLVVSVIDCITINDKNAIKGAINLSLMQLRGRL